MKLRMLCLFFSAICVLNASYFKPLLLGQVHAPIKKTITAHVKGTGQAPTIQASGRLIHIL